MLCWTWYINYINIFFLFSFQLTLVFGHCSGNGILIHFTLRKFYFLHPSKYDVISGSGQLVHLMGKDEVEWHSVLSRKGNKPGLLYVSGIMVESISFCFLRWISGTVQALKELTVVWIWHCPLHNLLKVRLWNHRISSWPLCSFHSRRGQTAFFLMLPPPRCSFYLLQNLILSCEEVA